MKETVINCSYVVEILQFQLQSKCGESLCATLGTALGLLNGSSLRPLDSVSQAHSLHSSNVHNEVQRGPAIDKSHRASERLDFHSNFLISGVGLFQLELALIY